SVHRPVGAAQRHEVAEVQLALITAARTRYESQRRRDPVRLYVARPRARDRIATVHGLDQPGAHALGRHLDLRHELDELPDLRRDPWRRLDLRRHTSRVTDRNKIRRR